MCNIGPSFFKTGEDTTMHLWNFYKASLSFWTYVSKIERHINKPGWTILGLRGYYCLYSKCLLQGWLQIIQLQYEFKWCHNHQTKQIISPVCFYTQALHHLVDSTTRRWSSNVIQEWIILNSKADRFNFLFIDLFINLSQNQRLWRTTILSVARGLAEGPLLWGVSCLLPIIYWMC